MIINGKASLNYNQIIDRVQKGTPNIEIQLLNEFIENPKYCIPEDILNLIQNNECNIQVIHMPLWENYEYEVEKKETKKMVEKVCQFAQTIAEIEQHSVLIVIHISDSIVNLSNYNMLNKLKTLIVNCLETYKNIEIAFENTININLKKNNNIYFTNSVTLNDNKFIFSNIEFATFINHERCGIVLDTCHLLITKNLFKKLERFFECKLNSKKIIEEAFQQATSFIKLIHLNYAEKHGNDEFHSLPFLKTNKKSMKYLKYFMKLYKKYNYNCMITLEINENNYLDAKNFEKSYKNLKKIIKEVKNED